MGFWKREDELERELRARRPEPRRELIDEIASRIVGERRRGAGRGARLGVALALTAGMLAALGAFGSLGYAANGVSHAVTAAVHAVVPAKPTKPSTAVSSAAAQYRVPVCLQGHTLLVDSHAESSIESEAGATPGNCAGGSFKPSGKLIFACFKGENVKITQVSADTAKERARLRALGITIGFCKA
jgi:hypothetical protein